MAVEARQTAMAIVQGILTQVHPISSEEAAARNHNFRRLTGRIRELEADRDRFLRIVAHELRNPLAGIKGIACLLRRRLVAGKPPEEMIEMLGVMESEINRLSGLLDEVLDAFHIKEDQYFFQTERVNLAQVVRSAMRPSHWLNDGRHSFSVEGCDRDVYVIGEYSKLQTVLRNLISNAVKFSPDGGAIVVRLSVNNNQALISVRDNGLGIPTDQLSHVFDEFVRADNLKGRDPGGLGLGLSICRDIVRQYRGRIWAESEEGQGTTMNLAIPCSPG